MINLLDYGWFGYEIENELDENTIAARVIAVHKDRYNVVSAHGISNAVLKSNIFFGSNMPSLTFPTTGDFVLINYNPLGDSQIIKTLDRKTFFSRRDPTPGRGEQAVAANFDYVFIMASLNFDFNIGRMERYLTIAWQSGGIPVIVLTKSDLVSDYEDILLKLSNIAVGVDILALSAVTKNNFDKLDKYLQKGKTICFLGSSGVGKSSLLNALSGDDIMEVKGIREDDSKGRHTTTHRQLIRLSSGALIIDTPGMRELGMWDVSTGLNENFKDVVNYSKECKFKDCTHTNEPGCAVKEAIENGELNNERLINYNKLKREARYINKKKINNSKQDTDKKYKRTKFSIEDY